MDYFQNLATIESPGKEHILEFLTQTEGFLNGVVNFDMEGVDLRTDPPLLFTPELHGLAQQVFLNEITASFNDLRAAIWEMPNEHQEFIVHGLIGAPQHFRLIVLGDLEQARLIFRKAWRWVRKMLILIYAILKSITDAAKPVAGFGVGGAILNYNDTLISLT